MVTSIDNRWCLGPKGMEQAIIINYRRLTSAYTTSGVPKGHFPCIFF